MITIQDFEDILENGIISKKKVILKISATWCEPCKRIKPMWENIKYTHDICSKCIVVEIDVDESNDIYTTLKRKRMLNGIPAFLMWEPRERPNWYAHDNGICNGDPNIVKLWIQNML